MDGNIADLRINLAESEKYNDELFRLLGTYCGKTPEQIKLDAARDFWLSSTEAKVYGIIDEIIVKS
jgi:ATP-dependent Clp protease protease subunit